MATIRRKVIREQAGENGTREWCALEVSLQEASEGRPARLSICGSAGYVVKPSAAKREALENCISYFEESPEEIRAMNERNGTNFRAARSAAKYVVSTDGDYHGLDVDGDTADGQVRITTACGQIRAELLSFFPEAKPYMKWHLNDMRAECVHQEARGETYKSHPDAACVDCGYKLGSGWKSRELPAEVVAWVVGLSNEVQ